MIIDQVQQPIYCIASRFLVSYNGSGLQVVRLKRDRAVLAIKLDAGYRLLISLEIQDTWPQRP